MAHSDAITAAIVSSGTALALGIVNGLRGMARTRFRRELEEMRVRVEVCDRERIRLRRNLELIMGALLALIPEPQRLDLLRHVAEDTIADQEDE